MDVREHVEKHLGADESLVLLTDTDIKKDGTFGRRWLAITSQRLLTFADGRHDGWEAEFPLSDIKEVRTVHLVGKMALEVETGRERVELLCCTNALTTRFAKVAGSLTAACKEGKPLDIDLDDEDKRTCDNCGRLLPEAGSFCPACLKKGKVLARLWAYLRPHRRKLVIVVCLVLAGTVVELAPPYLTKILVDDVLKGDGDLRLLGVLVLMLLVIYVTSTVIFALRGRIAAWLGSQVIHDVREDFYQAVQRLSLRRLDKTQTGSLISRLTGDTTMLNFFFIDTAAYVAPVFLQVAGICVMLFVLNWKLALLVLIPGPLIVVSTVFFFRRLRRRYHLLWQRRAKMTARATDAISGIRVVKAFSQEPREIRRFNERSIEFANSTARAESLYATYYPFMNFLTMTGIILVWYFGGRSVVSQSITLGTMMAFIGYLAMFYGPIQMMTRFADWMNRCFTSAQRLFEITDADQEHYEDVDGQPMDVAEGAFEFDNVEFGYTKDRPVLKGLTIKVEPGEMIGLVGRSGVGKTTLTNLICRFYDVDEGAIKIDGVDIRKIRLRDLRRHIGVVPQESFLFDGSVAENIAYAKPGATREDIVRAAKAAHAHGFIMRLPDGYDTRCGERGARLSGGEKQRIAIARAILRDPKILILDEATSSVDTETEELIQEALATLIRGRTTFAIAHRLSTLRNASRLLVIDDGKVAEFGSHDELLKKKGIYHGLVEMQTRMSAIKAVDG